MKFPIEWHRGCLENSIRTNDERKKILNSLQCEIARAQDQNDFYAYQIDLAKKRGRTAFDRDSFGVKRKKEIN